jgi:hypothetical protein
MSLDFSALTQAVVAGVSDVRACLMVSRDGLALAVSPATEEGKALTVWTRITGLGDVERGFVSARDEQVVFARRGPYAGLAITGPSARPGLVLDALDQMLLAAEEARARRDVVREVARPAEREAPASPIQEAARGPRTPLHRETRPAETPAPVSPPSGASPAAGGAAAAWAERFGSPDRPEQPAHGGGAPRGEEAPVPRPEEDDLWVDRVALAREFAAILTPEEEEEES